MLSFLFSYAPVEKINGRIKELRRDYGDVFYQSSAAFLTLFFDIGTFLFFILSLVQLGSRYKTVAFVFFGFSWTSVHGTVR